jgi:hypothetical protein
MAGESVTAAGLCWLSTSATPFELPVPVPRRVVRTGGSVGMATLRSAA